MMKMTKKTMMMTKKKKRPRPKNRELQKQSPVSLRMFEDGAHIVSIVAKIQAVCE